jgi:hypothetical protein
MDRVVLGLKRAVFRPTKEDSVSAKSVDTPKKVGAPNKVDAPKKTDGTVSAKTATKLRRYNVLMGTLHLAQAIAVLALANGFTLPVVATFMKNAPGVEAPSVTTLFDFRYAWGVAAFLLVSAIAHYVIASPGYFPRYIAGIERGRNYARWVEYSVSSSIMIILIAMLVGIADIAALLALAGVNASMILFGLLQEKYEVPGKGVSLISYWFGVIAGAIPWIAITVYLVSPGVAAEPPAFVYGIFFSLFVFFNCFAIVMVLQYKKIGKWSDYVYGESTYVLLSLVAKSLLAWQVFAGTLAPTP